MVETLTYKIVLAEVWIDALHINEKAGHHKRDLIKLIYHIIFSCILYMTHLTEILFLKCISFLESFKGFYRNCIAYPLNYKISAHVQNTNLRERKKQKNI